MAEYRVLYWLAGDRLQDEPRVATGHTMSAALDAAEEFGALRAIQDGFIYRRIGGDGLIYCGEIPPGADAYGRVPRDHIIPRKQKTMRIKTVADAARGLA